MPVGLDKVLKPECGQPSEEFDLTLDSALSGWVIGKMTSDEAGWRCEQIIREYFNKRANSCCYAEGYDFEVGKLGNNATSGNISVFIYTICGEILAHSKNFYEIYGNGAKSGA